MGCAPSKQNAEQENDAEKRPLAANDKKPHKGRKSPKKDRLADGGNKPEEEQEETVKNNNANKEDGPIIEETVLKANTEPVSTTAAPPSEHNGSTPVDQTTGRPGKKQAADGVPNSSSPTSPIKEIADKYGELWDLTKGMPSPTSPYDDDRSPPPKPERLHHVKWQESGDGRSFHTFPRSRAKPRSPSDDDVDGNASTLERKVSLRERTPERRKDLDVSGNIYLGKSVEPPGRGRKIEAGRLDFLNVDTPEVRLDDKEVALQAASVKERAQAYLEHIKKKDDKKNPTSPIRRPVRKLVEEDSADESHNLSVTSQDGNVSVIELVNKEILEDYHEVPKKTFEEIEKELMQRAAEEAEQERIRKEEEEGRQRAADEEQERRREEERQRVKDEEERERVKKEEATIQHEEHHLKTSHIPETEGGEVDSADKGAQLEDRFYNNKAFEKPDIDSSNPEQQEAAVKIQTKYRQHYAKKVVVEKRKEQAAVKIQAGYRGWHDRKRVKEIKSHADAKSEQDAQRAHEDDTRGDTLNYDSPEVVAAATTIQAGFKGYKARKEVQELKARSTQQGQEHPGEEGTATPGDLTEEQPKVEGSVDKQVTEETAGDQQVMKETAGDQQVMKETAGDQEVTEETPGDQQVKEETAGDQQATDEASQDKQTIEDATEDKPAEDEVPKDEQVTNETHKTESLEDEASKDEQTTDQPSAAKQDEEKQEDSKIDEYPEEQQAAATKIQAGARGYLARKRVKAMRDGQATKLPDNSGNVAETQPTSTEPTPQAQDNSAESRTQDDAEPAAQTESAEPTAKADATQDPIQKEDDDKDVKKDVDYSDPEVEKAATKIQAGLRGMQARKKVKELKESEHGEKGGSEENQVNDDQGEEKTDEGEAVKDEVANSTEFSFDPNDPEVNKAASKIQAGFKGYKTRKELGDKLKHDEQPKADEAPRGDE